MSDLYAADQQAALAELLGDTDRPERTIFKRDGHKVVGPPAVVPSFWWSPDDLFTVNPFVTAFTDELRTKQATEFERRLLVGDLGPEEFIP